LRAKRFRTCIGEKIVSARPDRRVRAAELSERERSLHAASTLDAQGRQNCRELLQAPISRASPFSYALETKARAELGTEFAFEVPIAGMLLR